MKEALFLIVSIVLLSISCREGENGVENDAALNEKYFYVEFINQADSGIYPNTGELVKEVLFGGDYVMSNEGEVRHHGVSKIDLEGQVGIQEVDRDHPNIHKFRDFSTYDENDREAEKIVITLNKPISDSIRNFNIRFYKKLGHEDWQSVANPGNFRYKNGDAFNEVAFSRWMVEQITLLTFK